MAIGKRSASAGKAACAYIGNGKAMSSIAVEWKKGEIQI